MEKIYFKNKKLLEKKIEKMKKQGIKKIHIVSDFDRTLTNCFHKGKKIPSTIALIREGGYLTKDYPKKAFDLFNKYHPIELNNNLDYNYKFKKMNEWWKLHEKLLVKSKMNEKIIEKIIKKYPKIFRKGTKEFLNYLNANKIPLLIFSSGIGNLIENYLKKNNQLTPNIFILSNTFNFNSEGFATGYKNKVIHIMNKSEEKIQNTKYKKTILKRNNIILLGDSIEDANMVKDKKNNNIIRIGFLNENIKKDLKIYKKKFDIIITNDGSMNFVNNLLKKILK